MLQTALALAVLINLALGTPVLSADLPVSPPAGGEQEPAPASPPASKFDGPVLQPAPRPKPVSNPNLNPYNPEDPSCRAWTDGCRTCQRDASGAVHCSNIGIACQPGAVTCQ